MENLKITTKTKKREGPQKKIFLTDVINLRNMISTDDNCLRIYKPRFKIA